MAYYVLDENNNLIEATDKVLTALVEKVKCCVSGTAYNIAFITQAKYNELEAQGLINKATTHYEIIDDTFRDEINAQLYNIENTLQAKSKLLDDTIKDVENLEDVVIYVSEDANGDLYTGFDLSSIQISQIERYLIQFTAYHSNSDISEPHYMRCTRFKTDEDDGSKYIYFENTQRRVVIEPHNNEIYQEDLTVPYAMYANEAFNAAVATKANKLAVNTLTVDTTTSTVNDQVAITKTGLYAVTVNPKMNDIYGYITVMISVFNLNEKTHAFYPAIDGDKLSYYTGGYIWYSNGGIYAYKNKTEIIDCKLITEY